MSCLQQNTHTLLDPMILSYASILLRTCFVRHGVKNTLSIVHTVFILLSGMISVATFTELSGRVRNSHRTHKTCRVPVNTPGTQKGVPYRTHVEIHISVIPPPFLPGNTDILTKFIEYLRRVTPSPQPFDGRHARVIPASHQSPLDELQQLTLRQHLLPTSVGRRHFPL